jgi:malonyl-CoA decarboxylase
LRGVSLGNFLIKRVAETLKQEVPQLKTFCTLSPIPGLMGWLHKPADHFDVLPPAAGARAAQALAALKAAGSDDLAALTTAAGTVRHDPVVQEALLTLAAIYLVHASPTPQGDPVARFHLDNGARLERLNAEANLSAKGLKQSAGLMVNYLYDLQRIETCHDRFIHGRVVHSRAVSALL